jgi:two-component system NarL family sensor kinase
MAKIIFVMLIVFFTKSAIAQLAGSREEVDQLYAKGLKLLTQPDSMIIYAEKGYQVAKRIDYKAGEAATLKLKGIYAHRKGNFDQAIAYYQDALQFYQSENNVLEMGKVNLNIATSYGGKSDFIHSTQYGLAALKQFERVDFLSGQGRVLNLLGISAFTQNDFRAAKIYFLQYNALVKKAKDTIEIASSYNNLGSAYQKMLKSDSAIYYLNLSQQIHRKKNNLIGVGIVQENIGNIYLDVVGDYKKALNYYQQAMASYNTVGATEKLGHIQMNIGISYGKLKDTVTARKYLNKAIELAKTSGEKIVLQKSYEELSAFDAANKEFRDAYVSLKTSMGHSDSIWNGQKVKAVEELKAKYNVEKKELAIRSLHQQNKIKDLEITRRNYLLAIGGFILVIGALFYSRQRLKAETQLQLERNRQQEKAAKAVLLAEERERQRIAADLHDGVGQLLSTALLSIKSLFKKLPLTDAHQLDAERSISLVTESYNEVRTISHQMIPNALLKAGLVAAVRDFLETVNSDRFNVNLSVAGISSPLDEQTETILYRIIQEAVNNVIKYAKASKLHVQLAEEDELITLAIEDNGVGFDVDRAIKGEGIGLRNIISRVQFLKGTVDFDSKPGKGTVIILSVPALSRLNNSTI